MQLIKQGKVCVIYEQKLKYGALYSVVEHLGATTYCKTKEEAESLHREKELKQYEKDVKLKDESVKGGDEGEQGGPN